MRLLPLLPAAIVSNHPIFSGIRGYRTRRNSLNFVRRATLLGGSVPVACFHSASAVRDVSTTQALHTAPQLARSSTGKNENHRICGQWNGKRAAMETGMADRTQTGNWLMQSYDSGDVEHKNSRLDAGGLAV